MYTSKGDTYTIVREAHGEGAKLWGQISGGVYCGCWIALDFTQKTD